MANGRTRKITEGSNACNFGEGAFCNPGGIRILNEQPNHKILIGELATEEKWSQVQEERQVRFLIFVALLSDHSGALEGRDEEGWHLDIR